MKSLSIFQNLGKGTSSLLISYFCCLSLLYGAFGVPTASPSRVTSTSNELALLAGIGSRGPSDGTGGKATDATFNYVRAVFQDTSGVTYVAENYCVRSFDSSSQIIYDYYGDCSTSGDSGDDGPATSALTNYPYGLSMTTTGVMYVAAYSNNRVQKVVNGIVSVFAGGGSNSPGDGGAATDATLTSPLDVFVNTQGLLYVICNNIVRTVSVAGILATYAGTGSSGYTGDGGPATSALLGYPTRITVDTAGTAYVALFVSNAVRKIGGSKNIITTYWGKSGSFDYAGENLPATSSGLYSPGGMALDNNNQNLYVGDYNHRIYVLSGSTKTVSTFAGSGTSGNTGDGGDATAGTLKSALSIGLDTSSNLYFGDFDGCNVRAVLSTMPTTGPTVAPTVTETSLFPSVAPTYTVTCQPTAQPTLSPTSLPSVSPTVGPTQIPTTAAPSLLPSVAPSLTPSARPSLEPTLQPTFSPTLVPTTANPSVSPSFIPTIIPTVQPTVSQVPTEAPSEAVAASTSSFSTGAIIGIAVGGAVVLILVGIAVFKYPLGGFSKIKPEAYLPSTVPAVSPDHDGMVVPFDAPTGGITAAAAGVGGKVIVGGVTKRFDVFLTHDWGTDELGRSNHHRVVEVGKQLRELGIHAWLDEEELSQNILEEMTKGIDDSHYVVVFITERYMSKVNGKDGRDNCKFEFQYAFKRLGPQSLIPVVMEARMRDQSKWGGVCGGALNSLLYVDMVNDDPSVFRQRCRELKDRIESLKAHEHDVC